MPTALEPSRSSLPTWEPSEHGNLPSLLDGDKSATLDTIPSVWRRCSAQPFSLAWKSNLAKLMGLAAEMAGKMSISGVQEKVSLRLSDDTDPT